MKAQVFISCGQASNSNELETARLIAKRLEEEGYEPYIAVEEQTLLGLKENIFVRLSESEYFLFIDFKREEISKGIHRGSLFSHQELAIASFLDIPVIAFQEDGVKKEDGLLRFIQGNVISFSDRHLLPSVVSDYARKNWSSNWKNELKLKRVGEQHEDATRYPEKKLARFYQIEVENIHLQKAAVNCYAYLETAKNINTGELVPLEVVEFKWSGYIFPNAVINSKSSRRFDAFFVCHDQPDKLFFNIFTDSTLFIPKIEGSGEYELTYRVVSENFKQTRAQFKLVIGNNLSDIKFFKP